MGEVELNYARCENGLQCHQPPVDLGYANSWVFTHTHFYWPSSADTLSTSGIAALLLATFPYNSPSSQALYSTVHEHVRSCYNFSVFACRVHLWSVSNCRKR